jgi:hypothetical protein
MDWSLPAGRQARMAITRPHPDPPVALHLENPPSLIPRYIPFVNMGRGRKEGTGEP